MATTPAASRNEATTVGPADPALAACSEEEPARPRACREMVLLLAGVLDVPLRERNALLLAAGYAPIYREAGLGAPEMKTPARPWS